MNLIVAVDKNWAIGYGNKLLVSIPQDMKFFRETTSGKVVVMGRKTLESFPGGQPLKKRTNIVLTGNQNYEVKDAVVVHDIDSLLEDLKERERQVIVLRFGLEDGHPRTLEEVGKEFNVTRERIRQIEAKALRKLRNPVRSKRIRDFL